MQAGESFHNEEFVKQALHEEAVIQPSVEGRYIYSTTSHTFNRILSDLLALDVKLKQENKAILLL